MGSDGFARLRDKAKIRFLVFIQRRRNADDDSVHLREQPVVRGRFETVCASFLDFRGRNAVNIRTTLHERGNFALIDVESGYLELLLDVEQSQGKTDIAKADNGHAGLAGFDP